MKTLTKPTQRAALGILLGASPKTSLNLSQRLQQVAVKK